MIVVDACTVVSSALADENGAASDAVLEHVARESALVPGNFWSEIVQALARAERRNRLDETTASLILAELRALPIAVEVPDPSASLALAKKYQLNGYDAAYLALALQAQLPLATVDAALGAAAKTAKCFWKSR